MGYPVVLLDESDAKPALVADWLWVTNVREPRLPLNPASPVPAA